jgi:hypothetical protein
MSVRAISLGVLMLLFGFTAAADEFTLTASAFSLNISLTLEGTESPAPGVFYITDLTGTVDVPLELDLANASLLPTTGPGEVTTSPTLGGLNFPFNNVLNMNSPTYFDFWGLGIALSDGTVANIFTFDGVSNYVDLTPDGLGLGEVLNNLTVTPVNVPTPEPASGFLAAIGIGILMLCVRRFRVPALS